MHEFVIVKGLGSVRRLSCAHSLKMFDYKETVNRRRYLRFMMRLSSAESSPFVFLPQFKTSSTIYYSGVLLNRTTQVFQLKVNPTYRLLSSSSSQRKPSVVRPAFPVQLVPLRAPYGQQYFEMRFGR